MRRRFLSLGLTGRTPAGCKNLRKSLLVDCASRPARLRQGGERPRPDGLSLEVWGRSTCLRPLAAPRALARAALRRSGQLETPRVQSHRCLPCPTSVAYNQARERRRRVGACAAIVGRYRGPWASARRRFGATFMGLFAGARRLGDLMPREEDPPAPTRGVLDERDLDLLTAGPAPTLAGEVSILTALYDNRLEDAIVCRPS